MTPELGLVILVTLRSVRRTGPIFFHSINVKLWKEQNKALLPFRVVCWRLMLITRARVIDDDVVCRLSPCDRWSIRSVSAADNNVFLVSVTTNKARIRWKQRANAMDGTVCFPRLLYTSQRVCSLSLVCRRSHSVYLPTTATELLSALQSTSYGHLNRPQWWPTATSDSQSDWASVCLRALFPSDLHGRLLIETSATPAPGTCSRWAELTGYRCQSTLTQTELLRLARTVFCGLWVPWQI